MGSLDGYYLSKLNLSLTTSLEQIPRHNLLRTRLPMRIRLAHSIQESPAIAGNREQLEAEEHLEVKDHLLVERYLNLEDNRLEVLLGGIHPRGSYSVSTPTLH